MTKLEMIFVEERPEHLSCHVCRKGDYQVYSHSRRWCYACLDAAERTARVLLLVDQDTSAPELHKYQTYIRWSDGSVEKSIVVTASSPADAVRQVVKASPWAFCPELLDLFAEVYPGTFPCEADPAPEGGE